MANIADFVKIPKIDCHNNLQAGMRYSSYVRWSGFMIPNFPETEACYDPKLKDDYIFYTSLRINNKKDFQNLLYMSVAEAAADNVKIIDGIVAVDLCEKCGSSAEFIEAINEVTQKYEGTVKVRPVLMINSDFGANTFLAQEFIEARRFDEIFVTGSKYYLEGTDRYDEIFKMAKASSVKSKIDCISIFSENDFLYALTKFIPDAVKDPSPEICTQQCIDFIKEHNIVVQFSPFVPSDTEEAKTEKIKIMRKIADAGIKIKICSDCVLFTCKSISEFAADMCNSGYFTEQEVIQYFLFD